MTESSIAEKIREKKKAFLAREQEIVESAKSLLIDHHVDKITVAEIAKKASIGTVSYTHLTLPTTPYV